MSIGQRLRERRTLTGLTLGQVAEYENVSKGYISELERGVKSPNVWPLLSALARRYDCSADYLLGLTDDPTPAGQASEIQWLYNRLSPGRQADLVAMADLWLRDEYPAYRLELVDKMLDRMEGAQTREELGALVMELLDHLRSEADQPGRQQD